MLSSTYVQLCLTRGMLYIMHIVMNAIVHCGPEVPDVCVAISQTGFVSLTARERCASFSSR